MKSLIVWIGCFVSVACYEVPPQRSVVPRGAPSGTDAGAGDAAPAPCLVSAYVSPVEPALARREAHSYLDIVRRGEVYPQDVFFGPMARLFDVNLQVWRRVPEMRAWHLLNAAPYCERSEGAEAVVNIGNVDNNHFVNLRAAANGSALDMLPVDDVDVSRFVPDAQVEQRDALGDGNCLFHAMAWACDTSGYCDATVGNKRAIAASIRENVVDFAQFELDERPELVQGLREARRHDIARLARLAQETGDIGTYQRVLAMLLPHEADDVACVEAAIAQH